MTIVLSLAVNTYSHSETMRWHSSVSTLPQVMTGCLTTPNHYLIQCWCIINKVQKNLNSQSKYIKFHTRKLIWKYHLTNGGHFVSALTHWSRVTHICISKLIIIGSDNGLSPGRRQAIILSNAGMLLIGPSGTKFSKILIEIHIFSFKKMHLKMSSAKWRSFGLGLNVFISLTMFHHEWSMWSMTFYLQHGYTSQATGLHD